ncbi:retinol dehydrogenase 13-like protein [Umbelopsis sp. PMI_123]|nr:retinol dehydrogenase 13-like protein [Umbelopsis sp. PMI_123]
MDFNSYLEQANNLLSKDIVVDGHIVPVKYVAGAVCALVGLSALKTYFNGPKNNSKAKLTGKTAVITGANDGIGKETAIDLAKRGATVIIACRPSEKSNKALADIRSASKSKNVILEPIDLADLDSVKAFAIRYLESGRPIHILINNAGIMALPKRQESKQGYELQFATNHLAHYLLTELLLPVIKKSEPARIINLSSRAMYRGAIHFDDIQLKNDYQAWKSYNQSKLANVLYTGYLSRQLKGTGVVVGAVHPGVVRTSLARYQTEGIVKMISFMAIYPTLYLLTKSAWYGAQTTLHLATSDNLNESNSGEYWADCSIVRGRNKYQHDKAVEDKLIDVSRELVAQWL